MPFFTDTPQMDDRYWTHDPVADARHVDAYYRAADDNDSWGEDHECNDKLPPRNDNDQR